MVRHAGSPSNPTPYLQRWKTRFHYGGSYCRPPRQRYYIRRFESLHHYPFWNNRHRTALDWLYEKPSSGFEAVRQFGPHTIQLLGIPHGITNQFIEERLRRFFSQFGPIVRCYSVPHPKDPFQSNGVAYVTFKSKIAALHASKARVKLSKNFGNRILQSHNLETDRKQNPDWYLVQLHLCNQVVSIARQLYELLESYPMGLLVRDLPKFLIERKFVSPRQEYLNNSNTELNYSTSNSHGAIQAAGPSIFQIFGSWIEFLTSGPMKELFLVHGSNTALHFPHLQPPSRRTQRIQNLILEMTKRDEWIKHSGKSLRRLSADKTIADTSDSINNNKNNMVFFRNDKVKCNRMEKLTSCFNQPKMPIRDSIKVKQMSEREEDKYEAALITASREINIQSTGERKNNQHQTDTITNCILKPLSQVEAENVKLSLYRANMRKFYVSRRTLTPEKVNDILRKAHHYAVQSTEAKRSSSWTTHISKFPTDVQHTMNEFFMKPPLPESVQIQSRPESIYRRIYDERHIVALEIEKKNSEQKKREENKRELERHQLQLKRQLRELRYKENQIANIIGFKKRQKKKNIGNLEVKASQPGF